VFQLPSPAMASAVPSSAVPSVRTLSRRLLDASNANNTVEPVLRKMTQMLQSLPRMVSDEDEVGKGFLMWLVRRVCHIGNDKNIKGVEDLCLQIQKQVKKKA
jgi:hypothetical protein